MATYNPQDHIVSNKGFGVLAKPVDARSWWTDGIEQRPFASKAEVLAYFPTAASRKGNFLVFIGNEAYTFKGPADADLIPFVTQDVDSQPIEGSNNPIASGYFFGKEFGSGEGLTFTDGKLFAGETEVKLNLDYFAGIWKQGEYQQGWIVVSSDHARVWKARQNHASNAEPAAGVNWELLFEVPKVDATPTEDSANAIASGYVQQLIGKLAYFQNNQLRDVAGKAIALSVSMDSQPVKDSTNPVHSGYFFNFHKTLPRYNQAEKVWRDWQGNEILKVEAEPKLNSIYPVESGWLYTQMQRQVYYQHGRLQDFLGNDINVGSAGNAIYYATPKVYGSVEQLQALPYTEKVLGASYKVYDGTQGYTYEYRKTGEGEQVTIPTQVAQLRIGTETYENGVLRSLSTVNGAKYALLEGTFNETGSVYMRVVSGNGGYVPDAGAQPETFEQVVYANPEQPPVNGQRIVYSFTQTTETANLTYAPGVYTFVDITAVAGDWVSEERLQEVLKRYLPLLLTEDTTVEVGPHYLEFRAAEQGDGYASENVNGLAAPYPYHHFSHTQPDGTTVRYSFQTGSSGSVFIHQVLLDAQGSLLARYGIRFNPDTQMIELNNGGHAFGLGKDGQLYLNGEPFSGGGGSAKLYPGPGQNTDGAMTQKAASEALATVTTDYLQSVPGFGPNKVLATDTEGLFIWADVDTTITPPAAYPVTNATATAISSTSVKFSATAP